MVLCNTGHSHETEGQFLGIQCCCLKVEDLSKANWTCPSWWARPFIDGSRTSLCDNSCAALIIPNVDVDAFSQYLSHHQSCHRDATVVLYWHATRFLRFAECQRARSFIQNWALRYLISKSATTGFSQQTSGFGRSLKTAAHWDSLGGTDKCHPLHQPATRWLNWFVSFDSRTIPFYFY